MLNVSPIAVGVVSARTESTMPLAAEAAEEAPRALMMAAPRVCTSGMKLPLSQASLPITSAADLPPICAE